MDWFLYGNGLRHERVKSVLKNIFSDYEEKSILHFAIVFLLLTLNM